MQRFKQPVKLTLAFTISLIICQVALGLLTSSNPVVYTTAAEFLQAMAYLLIFCFRVGLVVSILCLITCWLSERLAFLTVMTALTLVLLMHISLVSYLLQTGILLGADFWGYSPAEITHTIGSSGGISFRGIIIWTLGLTTFIGFSYWVNQLRLPGSLATVFPILFALSYFIPGPSSYQFDSEQAYSYVKNPTTHFIKESFSQLLGPKATTENFDISEYPFLRPFDEPNTLGKYLPESDPLPNIVIIAVEGLGADFLTGGNYEGFTPFLDSLTSHGLFWQNCLSNSGRTFGVLPSILGSLPYGKSGFMNMGVNMPDHVTLFSILKQNGYHTSFFYGGNANFDQQDVFLERQGLDYIMDESKFPLAYHKMASNEKGFSWGFADREVFDYSVEKLKEFPKGPRASFYLTLTTHEPFIVPDDKFRTKASEILQSDKINEKNKPIYESYIEVFECLLYTDNSIKTLMSAYKNLPGYHQTIFIITGDHRLIPVPAENRLKRFHVPLLIYSPGLAKPLKTQSLVAHSQVSPSLLTYLKKSCNLTVPSQTSFISGALTDQSFPGTLDIPLMRNKNEIKEYVYETMLLSDDKLFEITPELLLRPTQDEQLTDQLRNRLALFQAKSTVALTENKLIPDSLSETKKHLYFELSENEKQFLKENGFLNLSPDSLYFKARNLALDRSFSKSRALIRLGLNSSPNYHDLRVLLSRTYSWDGDYETARFHLDEVFKRAEHYEDAYIALSDLHYWEKDPDSSHLAAQKGLGQYPQSIELLVRLGRAQLALGDEAGGKRSLNKVLRSNPDHSMAKQLLQK